MTLPPNETLTTAKLLKLEVDELRTLIETGAGGEGIPPSMITAKGDIIAGTGASVPTAFPVGDDGEILAADSSTTTGLKWITPPEGGGGGAVSSVAGKTGAVTLVKGDVGLGNVDNTSDANKPISTATQTALNAKANATTLTSHTSNTDNPHAVTKAQVGLGNVDNTSDEDKPISAAVQEALDEKADLIDGVIPIEQLPEMSSGAGVQVWEWYIDTAAQGSGTLRRYNDSGRVLTIVAVRVRANINGPTGNALVVDLDKNGTTIFTNQSNRPSITAGEVDSGKVTTIDVTSLSDGDYLVPNIDEVGSIVPGSGVLVSVTLQ